MPLVKHPINYIALGFHFQPLNKIHHQNHTEKSLLQSSRNIFFAMKISR